MVFALLATSCANKTPLTVVETITENMVFPEGVIEYNGAILSSNFGVSEFNPLNSEGKGYITSYKDGKNTILIPADSNLNAPKGMTIKNDKLFVCDVNKIVVYNLNSLTEAPVTITLPENEKMLNDVSFKGNDLYVTSTLTGNIFKIANVNCTDSITYSPIELYMTVPGANGILIVEDKMYVASFDPDSKAKAENGIYVIDMASDAPSAKIMTNKPGLYDSIVISEDGKTLYYSNWEDKEIGKIDLASGKVTSALLAADDITASPGDIAIINNTIVVPDLLANRVVVLPIF